MGPAAAFCGWAHSLAHLHPRRPHPLFGDQQINNLQKSHQTLSPRTREQRGLDLLLYVPANSEAAALSASVYVAEA